MLSSPNLGVKIQQYFVRSSDMFLDSKRCLRFGLILGLTGPAFEELVPGFSLFCSKAFSPISFSIFLEHPITKV